jgi:AbrB family looped-hinge helix DNA binding protein
MNSTITQKGQVTIPIALRKKLQLKPNDKVTFYEENNEIKLKKAKDFLSLQGSIQTKLPFNLRKIRASAKAYVAERHGKNN